MASTRQFNDKIIQYFPLKPPIMKYIFDNINYKHLYKLYQCCKLFPNKFALTVVHETDTQNSQLIFYRDKKLIPSQNISKIWLSENFHLLQFKPDLRPWISKIWICTIKSLKMFLDLSLNDFKLLVQSGKIESVGIEKVVDKNESPLSVEDIIAYLPNAYDISLFHAFVTNTTFPKLTKMKRNCKISYFALYDVTFNVSRKEFLKFLEMHASHEYARYVISADPSVPEKSINELYGKVYMNEVTKKLVFSLVTERF